MQSRVGQVAGAFKCQCTFSGQLLPANVLSVGTFCLLVTTASSQMEAQPPRNRDGGLAYPWQGWERETLTTAGVRVLRLGLSHLLGERGAGGVEAHLRVLRGLRATGRALGGVQVERRMALAAAAGGARQGPVGRRRSLAA